MSSLEALVPLIYHEKQQPGSQLCAQHALNAILQGDYFSAPDLAQFAQQLDTLEGSINNDAGPVSNNMDDTGFFSVEVLERALRIWGFTLVRWRSQDLRDRQETPHTQMAFLLNHEQHWFSLRRFGRLEEPENGLWFNLNSFLRKPEWVGNLYLGMVLSQAEDEGYSVFAVLPTRESPDGPTMLPHTYADDVASNLPPPTSSNMGAHVSSAPITEPSSSSISAHVPGFEDEDLELQAALQASLTGEENAASRSPISSVLATSANARRTIPPSRPAEIAAEPETDGRETHDPIAASMARNKAIMQRMLREQEMALREGYEEEVVRNFGGLNGSGAPRENDISSRSPEAGQSHPRGETEEALRRMMEESRRYGNQETPESMDMSGDRNVPGYYPVPDSEGEEPRAWPGSPLATASAFGSVGDRVYDDEDSELQAALRASLEGLPEGFQIPSTSPRVHAGAEPASHSTAQPEAINAAKDNEEDEEDVKPVEQIDAAEMRRRRLARFGG